MRCLVEKIGIHILAFLVARCQLLGLYPFVVPFFMAAYLQEKSSISLFGVMLVGILTTAKMEAVVRYSVVLLFLLVLLNCTDRKKIFSNNHQIALASGMILWAFSMPYQYIVTRKDVSLLYALLEGVVVSCFVLLFEQAFIAFRVGTRRMFATNERFIGLFALMVVALFGCPVVTEPLNIPFLLCSVLLLYNSYRFEGSVGMATGAVVGMVLAFQLEQVGFLAIMILLSCMIALLKDLGKIGVLLAFLAGYILVGYLYDTSFLEREMLIGIVTASIIFFVLPKGWMRRISQIKEGSTGRSQDLLIQEATKSRIYDFGQAFLAMEKMLSEHEGDRNAFEPHGLSNVYLSGDGISLLNVVEFQSNRLAELRKNFIRQLGQVGDIITTFPAEITDHSVQAELFEGRLVESFNRIGVVVTKALLIKDQDDRVKVYVSCYRSKDRVITGEQLAERVGKILGKGMVCVERGSCTVPQEESAFSFVEEGRYMLTAGVVRKNRTGEELCGDNFSVSKIDLQKAVMMLSDGMGTGEKAYMKSGQVVELLEQLLSAGFHKELAIELLNSFVSFLADGEVSSSLDLTVIDFYTGEADFIKLGASTTFIKRKDTVEYICSTSLPVGVLEQVEFDTCQRKLYHGDMIVMVSDGVLDGIIFEDKEDCLADIIAKQDTCNAQVMAENIMQEVCRMQRGIMRDDSTVLVAGVWRR